MNAWRTSKYRPFLNITSLIITVTFFLSTVNIPEARGGGALKKHDASQAASSLSTSPLSSLDIPDSIGNIVETYSPEPQAQSPEHFIIHIQDLHTHYQAQQNISKLILELNERFGINLVALEGAEGECNTEIFSAFPDKEINEKIANLFLKKGLFTGAEYLAVTNPGRVTLWGAEDARLYLEHLKNYQSLQPNMKNVDASIKALKAQLVRLKEKFYPGIVKEFEQKQLDYDEGRVLGSEYLIYLMELTDKSKIKPKGYPKTFKELRMLEDRIKQSFLKGEDSRIVFRLSKNLKILDNLYHIKALPEDLEYFNSHREEFTEGYFLANLSKLTGLTSDNRRLTSVFSFLSNQQDFYTLAMRRDNAIVENTIKLIDIKSSNIAILITGGFHTKGITKLFKDKGISYIVIAPKITERMDEKTYQFLLSSQMPSVDEFLNELTNEALVQPLISGPTGKIELVKDKNGQDVYYQDKQGNRKRLTKADYGTTLWALAQIAMYLLIRKYTPQKIIDIFKRNKKLSEVYELGDLKVTPSDDIFFNLNGQEFSMIIANNGEISLSPYISGGVSGIPEAHLPSSLNLLRGKIEKGEPIEEDIKRILSGLTNVSEDVRDIWRESLSQWPAHILTNPHLKPLLERLGGFEPWLWRFADNRLLALRKQKGSNRMEFLEVIKGGELKDDVKDKILNTLSSWKEKAKQEWFKDTVKLLKLYRTDTLLWDRYYFAVDNNDNLFGYARRYEDYITEIFVDSNQFEGLAEELFAYLFNIYLVEKQGKATLNMVESEKILGMSGIPRIPKSYQFLKGPPNIKVLPEHMRYFVKNRNEKIKRYLRQYGKPEEIFSGEQTLCLTPDSLISLADGTQKPLIELRQGDMVLSLNEKTQKLESHRVNALLDMGVKPVYRITTQSGKTLKTTSNHPYLTTQGWRKLKEIKVGDEIAVVELEAVESVSSPSYYRQGSHQLFLSNLTYQIFDNSDNFVYREKMQAQQDNPTLFSEGIGKDISKISVSGNKNKRFSIDKLINFFVRGLRFDVSDIRDAMAFASEEFSYPTRTVGVNEEVHRGLDGLGDNFLFISKKGGIKNTGSNVINGNGAKFLLKSSEIHPGGKGLQDNIDRDTGSFDTRFSMLNFRRYAYPFFNNANIDHFLLPPIVSQNPNSLSVFKNTTTFYPSQDNLSLIFEPHRVNALLDMGVKPVYKITTASGKQLKTTLTHPYLTRNGWRKLKDIKVGEEVVVVNQNLEDTLKFRFNLYYSRGRQISQLFADEHFIYGNHLAGFDQRRLRKVGELGFLPAQEIVFFSNGLGNLRGNRHHDDIAMEAVESIRRDNYRGSLFKGGEIRKRKRDKDNIALLKGYHKHYLQGYPRSQKSFPLPLEAKHHLCEFLGVPAGPQGVSFAPQALIEKFPSQLFQEYPYAFCPPDNTKYNTPLSSLSSITYEPITTIEYLGTRQVYDIEVDSTHNFIAQGIVAHNTYSGQGEEGGPSTSKDNLSGGQTPEGYLGLLKKTLSEYGVSVDLPDTPQQFTPELILKVWLAIVENIEAEKIKITLNLRSEHSLTDIIVYLGLNINGVKPDVEIALAKAILSRLAKTIEAIEEAVQEMQKNKDNIEIITDGSNTIIQMIDGYINKRTSRFFKALSDNEMDFNIFKEFDLKTKDSFVGRLGNTFAVVRGAAQMSSEIGSVTKDSLQNMQNNLLLAKATLIELRHRIAKNKILVIRKRLRTGIELRRHRIAENIQARESLIWDKTVTAEDFKVVAEDIKIQFKKQTELLKDTNPGRELRKFLIRIIEDTTGLMKDDVLGKSQSKLFRDILKDYGDVSREGQLEGRLNNYWSRFTDPNWGEKYKQDMYKIYQLARIIEEDFKKEKIDIERSLLSIFEACSMLFEEWEYSGLFRNQLKPNKELNPLRPNSNGIIKVKAGDKETIFAIKICESGKTADFVYLIGRKKWTDYANNIYLRNHKTGKDILITFILKSFTNEPDDRFYIDYYDENKKEYVSVLYKYISDSDMVVNIDNVRVFSMPEGIIDLSKITDNEGINNLLGERKDKFFLDQETQLDRGPSPSDFEETPIKRKEEIDETMHQLKQYHPDARVGKFLKEEKELIERLRGIRCEDADTFVKVRAELVGWTLYAKDDNLIKLAEEVLESVEKAIERESVDFTDKSIQFITTEIEERILAGLNVDKKEIHQRIAEFLKRKLLESIFVLHNINIRPVKDIKINVRYVDRGINKLFYVATVKIDDISLEIGIKIFGYNLQQEIANSKLLSGEPKKIIPRFGTVDTESGIWSEEYIKGDRLDLFLKTVIETRGLSEAKQIYKTVLRDIARNIILGWDGMNRVEYPGDPLLENYIINPVNEKFDIRLVDVGNGLPFDDVIGFKDIVTTIYNKAFPSESVLPALFEKLLREELFQKEIFKEIFGGIIDALGKETGIEFIKKTVLPEANEFLKSFEQESYYDGGAGDKISESYKPDKTGQIDKIQGIQEELEIRN